jgi:hypothetical protein
MPDFIDFPQSSENWEEICKLVTSGVIKGYNLETDRPELQPKKNVSTAEQMKMISNFLTFLKKVKVPRTYEVAAKFYGLEVAPENHWFMFPAQIFFNYKITFEKEKLFEPMTRLEFATSIYDVLQAIEPKN